MFDIFLLFQAFYLAYHFINGSETKFSHYLSQLLCNKFEKVHHMICITGKALTQFRILRRYTNRASIKMTFTHHNTTLHDKSSGGYTPFFCTKQCSNGYIP